LPSREEIEGALKYLKNNKAAGSDSSNKSITLLHKKVSPFTQQKHRTFTRQKLIFLHGRSIALSHTKSIILGSAPTMLFAQQETRGLGSEFHY
jgi:hypothetical protein